MAKKQVKTAPIVAPAAPAAAAKPRVTASRHSKAKSEKAPEPKIEVTVIEPIVAAEVILEEVVVAAPAENPQEEIAKIAYGYYAARGHQHGNPADDWFRAEREYYSRR